MILEAPNRLKSYDDLGITFFLAGTIDNVNLKVVIFINKIY